jgi:hypothetical protein
MVGLVVPAIHALLAAKKTSMLAQPAGHDSELRQD